MFKEPYSVDNYINFLFYSIDLTTIFPKSEISTIYKNKYKRLSETLPDNNTHSINTAYLIIDNTSLTNEKYENQELDINVPINNLLAKSLEDTSTTASVNFSLNPLDLDYVLYSLVDSIDTQIEPLKINGSKVELIDGIYYLKVNLNFQNINSIVDLELDFEEKDNVFTIYIKDLKLGKLGVNNKLVHYFIDKIDISTLITTLENNDIYCSINLQDFSISISQQNLFNMIRSRTLNDPNSHLINLMLDVIKNHHELYNFETENELKLNVNLSNLKFNTSNSQYIPIDFSSIETSTETLLKNKIINYSQANDIFNFLINGYDDSSEELIDKINSIDLSSINITDKTNYTGLIDKDSLSLKEYISGTNIDYTLGNTSIKLDISEDNLNSVIQNNDLKGSSYTVCHSQDENIKYSNQMSYVVIEDIKMNMLNNEIKLDLIINIHGYRSGIYADFSTPTHQGLVIEGTLTNLQIGEIELNDYQKTEIIQYLNTMIEDSWISLSNSDNTIKLDFTDLIIENEVIKTFTSLFGDALTSTSIKEDKIEISFGI